MQIRDASPEDRPHIVEIAKRLAEFPIPEGRTAREIVDGEVRTLDLFFRGAFREVALLVAVDGDRRLGFAFVETASDYFTGERHGHLGILAVAADAEGLGVGAALMEASEAWARTRGLRRFTLNVFEGNVRARRLYERRGYKPETLRYVRYLE
jgi:GNAT superfamily N-acetyltransferase